MSPQPECIGFLTSTLYIQLVNASNVVELTSELLEHMTV